MNAQRIGWFVFLAVIIKTTTDAQTAPFRLQVTRLTAAEGSCTEIKCSVYSTVKGPASALWFWMKDGIWNEEAEEFNATFIFSSNHSKLSVSPDFEGRVRFIGSPSSTWNQYNPSTKSCNILICNLTKSDSGTYSFRFTGKPRWHTKPGVKLTVIDNLCPITFEGPAVVKENEKIMLTCSTLSSCPSNPQIEDLTSQTRLSDSTSRVEKPKSTTFSTTANWQNDGKTFSCQAPDNKDPYLIRNLSVTVEYSPKGVSVQVSPANIKEGEPVTFNCSGKGRPAVNFTWFKNGQRIERTVKAEWTIPSIKVSDEGTYYCRAQNKHGTLESNSVSINVTYKPDVVVWMNPPASVVREGDEIVFTCIVTRSKPQPQTYVWTKDGKGTVCQTSKYYINIKPDSGGSYTCSATNTAGTGTSAPRRLEVQYRPRETNIHSRTNDKVKVGSNLTLNCEADGNPGELTYSWYRYYENKQIDSSQSKSYTTQHNQLSLVPVQRTDEACYMCNATNIIGTGENSEPLCIQVLYPPTNIMLSMDTEVTEGQPITINCTVESSPPSFISLTRTSTSSPETSEARLKDINRPSNTLQHNFHVTSTDTGFYTCSARNSEGSTTTKQRKLVVKYCPKDVTVRASPGLVVNENSLLTLECSAQSHPPVTSVTWVKVVDGKKKEIIQKTGIIEVKSVGLSDSGLYTCKATNNIGTGNSKQVEVKVKYGPKLTEITRGAEQQQPDGKSSVTLSCSSHSYPPVIEYSWFRKEEMDKNVFVGQNYTVNSDQPGEYYCIARNEINKKLSDPVALFVYRRFVKALKLFSICLMSLLIIFLILFIWRHKRKKSIRQGTTNTAPCVGFLGYVRRRDLMNEPVMAEPSRSRDDLLPDQPCRPKAQQRQRRPDSTPASNIDTVYCTVNLPARKQAPSAQKPIRQQGGQTKDASLNYASLHFGNKQKNKQAKAEENAVYAVVSKQKLPKKESLEDYENVCEARAGKAPDPLSDETETSEDEVELNYTQVSFKAKAGHQKGGRDSSSDTSTDSSTSDEEETQYSQVKI